MTGGDAGSSAGGRRERYREQPMNPERLARAPLVGDRDHRVGVPLADGGERVGESRDQVSARISSAMRSLPRTASSR